MRPSVDQFVMQVEERPETGVEAVQFATIASAYIRVYLHPSGEVVPVKDLLNDVCRGHDVRLIPYRGIHLQLLGTSQIYRSRAFPCITKGINGRLSHCWRGHDASPTSNDDGVEVVRVLEAAELP